MHKMYGRSAPKLIDLFVYSLSSSGYIPTHPIANNLPIKTFSCKVMMNIHTHTKDKGHRFKAFHLIMVKPPGLDAMQRLRSQHFGILLEPG